MKVDFVRRLQDSIAQIIFVLRGKKPWTFGYHAYKQNKITEYIESNEFNVSFLGKGYGYRIDERVIEYPWLLSHIPDGDGLLLDAGSALNFEFLLDMSPLREKKIFISTLAPESNFYPEKNISYIYEDLRSSCFKDNFFDYIVSISTIEHIGLDNTLLYTEDETKKENDPHSYLKAIDEFRRMLKPNGKLYLTLPFGKYKNHTWFQVFNAEMLDRVIQIFSSNKYKEFIFRYESTGWVVSSREESREATCFDINVKNKYDSDFAAFSRAVVCLEITK